MAAGADSARDWYVTFNAGDGWERYRGGMTEVAAERLAIAVRDVFFQGCEVKIGQGEAPLPNPPWVTRTLALDWNMVQEHVSDHPQWMPSFSKAHASRKGELVAKMDALGCGAYGCVLPTNDPAVVLKITTDKSEVAFATQILPEAPAAAQEGVVVYEEAVPLSAKHRGHKVVALWRQAADHVGKILDPKVTPARGERKQLADLIDHEWSVAQVVLTTLLDARHKKDADTLYQQAQEVAPIWTPRPGDKVEAILDELDTLNHANRLAAALTYFKSVCQAMNGTPLETVGRALVAFLGTGVFVGDIHEGNVGRVDGVWKITDPGNTIVLPAPWR